jgi:transcriptional regulator with XRE-family HTH domain
MSKTIHRQEYRVLLSLLKQRRQDAGITQVECSAALGRSQSYVSDIERGVRRLDVVQLRDLCQVMRQDFVAFIRDFEKTLSHRHRVR